MQEFISTFFNLTIERQPYIRIMHFETKKSKQNNYHFHSFIFNNIFKRYVSYYIIIIIIS